MHSQSTLPSIERVPAQAYSGSPGFSGTAFDSSSGFCPCGNPALRNCILCPCRWSRESRGCACSAGPWAGHRILYTCEFEACQMCPRCTATSAKANAKAGYPSRSRCFLLRTAALGFGSPGPRHPAPRQESRGSKASFYLTLPKSTPGSLSSFFHCRQLQMTTKSLEIRTTSMTLEPKIDL